MGSFENARPMGAVCNMPFADYLKVDAVNGSALKQLARSPWHYRNRRDTDQTRSMFRGTLAHAAVLESNALQSRYVVVPEDAPRRPTAAQWAAKRPSNDSIAAMDWWRTFNESAHGREVVTAAEYSITQQQVSAVLAVPELAGILAAGQSEVSVFWIDPETGIYCKARPDFVHTLQDGRAVLLDLKTTADESPAAFSRTVAKLSYHLQQAHYCAGWKAATGQEVAAFVFAAVSSAPPVLAVPYLLDAETCEQGETERSELIETYAQCVRSGNWPAYGQGYQTISLPTWAKRNSEIEFEFEQGNEHV